MNQINLEDDFDQITFHQHIESNKAFLLGQEEALKRMDQQHYDQAFTQGSKYGLIIGTIEGELCVIEKMCQKLCSSEDMLEKAQNKIHQIQQMIEKLDFNDPIKLPVHLINMKAKLKSLRMLLKIDKKKDHQQEADQENF